MTKEDKINAAKALIAEHEKAEREDNEAILKLIEEHITAPAEEVSRKELVMEIIDKLIDSSDKHWRLVNMLKSYTFRLTYEGPTSTHNRIMHALE